MNAPVNPMDAEFEKFAIGQPVPRKEDPLLVTGKGSYTDDLNLAGQAYAYIVRSPIAHGVINSIETDDAKAMPGVLAILTGVELAAMGFAKMGAGMSFLQADGSDMPKPVQTVLALDKVRYVGDPVAVVVAETYYQAKDAGEAVFIDIEQLPAVTRAAEAVKRGAPQLYDATPGNVVLDFHHGDKEGVAKAFAEAAHTVSMAIDNSRIVVAAMEPRSAIADYDAANDHYTMRLGCQGAFPMRNNLAGLLGVEREQVRVLIGHVGGSFGMKSAAYPEYVGLLAASKVLGRPVKWTDERSGSFLSDSHGRAHEMQQAIALDAEGRMTAIRVQGYGNIGANLSNGTVMQPTGNVVKNTISVYATPKQEIVTQAVFTNATPVGAYRGAGRPESNYYVERLLDTAAHEMGIDRIEIRKRNHIQPDQFPYLTPAGTTYDSGEFSTVLDKAVAAADWDGFEARRAESAKKGLLRGRGIGQYLEVTGPPQNEMGGIRFEDDGSVTIITGTLDYGQGHATPFAQVLAARLGVPFDRIKLLQGDSDELIAGGGTGGSKSMMASGKAIFEASEIVKENGAKIAAHLLEASVADIEFHIGPNGGAFEIVGTDRRIGIMELAEQIRGGVELPDDVPASLSVAHIADGPPFSFPNGCHIAEVEVDPDTGVTQVVKYTMVNDFGVVVNPLMVGGQAHGGVAQGIGQCLLERVVYDEDGQPQTGSFMDYTLPRATDMPDMSIGYHEVPAKTNVLGIKGCGEAGCAGAMPSVMNALVDALREPYGINHIDMPATPLAVWDAIQAAQG
ncbi:MAG: xanthine dehydrogenase family protein molybdopterin-binding subunit [Alphaproteobacteria bacterium]